MNVTEEGLARIQMATEEAMRREGWSSNGHDPMLNLSVFVEPGGTAVHVVGSIPAADRPRVLNDLAKAYNGQ